MGFAERLGKLLAQPLSSTHPTTTNYRSVQFATNDGGAVGHRLQFAERGVARHVLHSAVRRRDQALVTNKLQRGANPRRHRLRSLDSLVAEVDDSQDHRLRS